MGHAGSSSFTVHDGPTAHRMDEAGPVVVWLRGEHDISTDGALCQALARAIDARHSGVVLDLGDVKLMSASTLGMIVAARELLGRQSRSLTVRSPSAFVRHIIGVCGLNYLSGPGSQRGIASRGRRSALGSYPRYPGSRRRSVPSSTLAPDRLPAHACHAADLAAQAPVEPKQLADIA